jgi:hypothetical protein
MPSYIVIWNYCIQVLGSNFQSEYDGNQASEKQRSKDIFTAITIGLTEYQRALQIEYEQTERPEERILLRLVETELFKVSHAAAELRDQNQARLELEQHAAENAAALSVMQSEVTVLKAGMSLLLKANGIDPSTTFGKPPSPTTLGIVQLPPPSPKTVSFGDRTSPAGSVNQNWKDGAVVAPVVSANQEEPDSAAAAISEKKIFI